MNIDYLSRSMKSPVIDRVGFTDAVMMYLQLPFREPQFDRMLVEALVSTEFFAFRDFVEDPSTAWNADPGTRKAMTRALKQPWLDTLQDYAVPFTYFGVVALGVEYAHIHRWVGDNSREMLLYLVATIAATYAIFAIYALPKVIARNRVVKRKVEDVMVAIEAVISFLRGGQVSIAELKLRVLRAEELAGVGWPTALHPILDDLAGRYQNLWARDR